MIALTLLSSVVLSAPAQTVQALASPLSEFESWTVQFSKSYSNTADKTNAEKVFNVNAAMIASHNQRAVQGLETYYMGLGPFTDLTQAEFKKFWVNSKYNRTTPRSETWIKNAAPQDSVDWRTKGAVTPVKNQGQCGSCWSFSTTGSTEGAWQIANNNLVVLSEQQLMDCSTAEGDHSCEGGLMDYAFKYIIQNGGLDTEADYPYQEKDEACDHTKEGTHSASLTSFTDVPQNSEDQLALAVAKGPVSVAIEADQAGFQHYSSGTFSGPCGTQLDHGVLVVGYTADYWIVKNSWGATWGSSGYIMMARGVSASGICGIAMQPSYPIAKAGPPGPGPSPSPPPPPGPPVPPSPATCGGVNPANRTNCGMTKTSDECAAAGCCYDTTNPNSYRCFQPDVCGTIDPAKRVDCGYQLSPSQCVAKGCCYDKSVPFTYSCFEKNAPGPSPPGPTPPGPPSPPPPPPPSPGPPSGAPYGDPSKGPCNAGEKAVQINGISGKYCAPSCSTSAPCPAVPAPATAAAQCVVSDPNPPPSLCAVICVPGADFLKSGDGGCMTGASCQAIQGTGVCTYPDSKGTTFAFNLNLSL